MVPHNDDCRAKMIAAMGMEDVDKLWVAKADGRIARFEGEKQARNETMQEGHFAPRQLG